MHSRQLIYLLPTYKIHLSSLPNSHYKCNHCKYQQSVQTTWAGYKHHSIDTQIYFRVYTQTPYSNEDKLFPF